ncbi:MAG: hypothetical protein AB7V00_03725 [Bacilli bacterium]
MKKLKTYKLIITPLISILFFSLSIVFAWSIFMKTKPLATFESGQIVVEVSVDETLIVETINITDLAFMDFSSDVISDEDGVLNVMATTKLIKIFNSASSSYVSNIIEITNQTEGLFFLFYFEGENLSSELMGLDIDWHNIISTAIGTELNESAQRTLLDSYNATVLSTISQTLLEPGEWLSLQVAIWGDYDALTDPTNYLTDTYSMQISIATTQWEGAI